MSGTLKEAGPGVEEHGPGNPGRWNFGCGGTKQRCARSHPDCIWNGSAVAATSGLPVGFEGRV